MKIFLIKDMDSDKCEIEVKKGTTIEELVKEYQPQLQYRVLAALRDNMIVPLIRKIEKPCTIQFLDMRHQSANLIYQCSLSFIYLKAVKDVLGPDVQVEIENSLSKGLYTKLDTKVAPSLEVVGEIQARMQEIIDADMPIVRKDLNFEEAVAKFEEKGELEKRSLLNKNMKKVKFYSIGDYENFFYDLMVPSTGYINAFELKKYRRGIIVRFPHPSNPAVVYPFKEESELYKAFGEAYRWGKIMGVSYVSDLNTKIEKGEMKELIQLSEALHEKKIAEIADEIKRSGRRIVLIAGPSSSGKTTFARRLNIQLKVNGLNPLYLGTDDYFLEREETPKDEKGEYDYENLNALDIELFNSNMNDLLAGKEVDLPEFDFLTGCKVFGRRITKITSNQPIVIEGIHALNNEMTPYISDDEKFRIYISPLTQLNIDRHNRIPTTDARMLRRIVRDYQYRGTSARGTIKVWPKVRRGEDKNIFPYNSEADVLFNSVHIYELAVLKKYAAPLLEDIKQDEPEYADARRLLRLLSYFKTIEDDSIIVNNSILREFIGGSVFVE